jgi:hypothetical protein
MQNTISRQQSYGGGRVLLAGLVAFAVAAAAHAAPTLSVRLVEASREGGGVGRDLGDVAAVLQQNMPFDTFRLLSSRTMRLPGDQQHDMGSGYAVRCAGEQQSLAITVSRDGRVVLRSTVALRDETPLILGGFPSRSGKIIIVLVVR